MSLESKLFVAAIGLGVTALVAFFIAGSTAFDTPGNRANSLAVISSGLFILAGLFGLTSTLVGLRTFIEYRVFRWWLPLSVLGTLAALRTGWVILWWFL